MLPKVDIEAAIQPDLNIDWFVDGTFSSSSCTEGYFLYLVLVQWSLALLSLRFEASGSLDDSLAGARSSNTFTIGKDFSLLYSMTMGCH